LPDTAAIVVAAIAFAIAFGVVRLIVRARDKKRAAQARQDELTQASRQVRRARQRKGR
jgi:flagellar biosynthesis/type III secretory pathway M-ring protein FliF/YscJ